MQIGKHDYWHDSEPAFMMNVTGFVWDWCWVFCWTLFLLLVMIYIVH